MMRICVGIFSWICFWASPAIAAEKPTIIEGTASVRSLLDESGDFIYSIKLKNNSKRNICVESASFPISAEYRGNGMNVTPPTGEADGPDLGELSPHEKLIFYNTVLVIFPGGYIEGSVRLKDIMFINQIGDYGITHRLSYIDCALLSSAPDVDAWSPYWKKHARVIAVKSRFTNK